MVLLHVKRDHKDLFIYETSCQTSLDDITTEVTEISNAALFLQTLASEVKELSKFGPFRSIEDLEQHLQSLELETKSTHKRKLRENDEDPTGRRVGVAPTQEAQSTLLSMVESAEALFSKERIKRREPLTLDNIEEEFNKLKGAVMIVYPEGLPPHDSVSMLLQRQDVALGEKKKELLGTSDSVLWWAGKRLYREKSLKDYIGRNEKTKIVAKIQGPTSGPPPREDPIDKETQKDLLSYWYKKQQIEKELAENDDDSYLNSEWANPHHLKNEFQNTSKISYKPISK